MNRFPRCVLLAGALMTAGAWQNRPGQPGRTAIDYPGEGAIFPPEFPAPAFLWRDAVQGATVWTIEVTFGGGQAGPRIRSAGEPMRAGKTDPRCTAPSR